MRRNIVGRSHNPLCKWHTCAAISTRTYSQLSSVSCSCVSLHSIKAKALNCCTMYLPMSSQFLSYSRDPFHLLSLQPIKRTGFTGIAGPHFRGCMAAFNVCVGWLVHVFHDHSVHTEPRWNFLGGSARAPMTYASYAPASAHNVHHHSKLLHFIWMMPHIGVMKEMS